MTNDLVEMLDGIPMVSSLQVAERFGKRHDNVLRSIQAVEASEKFRALNFKVSSYEGNNGRPNPLVWMTQDGFSFLAMGFTGKEAAEWREKFIEAFNIVRRVAVEADARAPSVPKDYAEMMELQQAFFRERQAELAAEKQKAILMLEDRTGMVNRMRAAEKRANEATERLRSVSKHAYKVLKEIEEGHDQDDLMAKSEATPPSLSLVKK